jgi:hypothetical protein
MRMDFKAIVKIEEGKFEKILIEMQKGKNVTDIYRFRRYLGENYTKTDIVDEKQSSLPISCIYFIGYAVPIKNAVVTNKKEFKDLVTGQIIQEKMEIMELLNHNSYFIFIDNLQHTEKEMVVGYSRFRVNNKYKIQTIDHATTYSYA